MPTLGAGSRLDNIAKSVNVHVQTQLVADLGYTVYYAGQDRLGRLPTRWVEADLIPGSAIAAVSTGSGGDTFTWTECFLNLNCFEQTEVGTGAPNIYTLITMVENIRSRFLVGSAIQVHDYASAGTAWVGALMVWERPSVTEVPVTPDSGIKQINISVPFRYHEVHAFS